MKFGGAEYTSVSGVATAIARQLHPGCHSVNGWRSMLYKGQPLRALRDRLLAKPKKKKNNNNNNITSKKRVAIASSTCT